MINAALLAEKIIRDGVAPDAAVGFAVWKGRDEGWVLGAGWSSDAISSVNDDAENHGPIFDLASLTKPMTAFAVALSPPLRTAFLGDALPEVARGDKEAPTARMPIELLLAHRAGLEAHLPLYEPIALGGRKQIDRAAALREVASARRAECAASLIVPAEGFPPIYSDLGYVLAGEALAKHHHTRDAGEAIENIVVRALGLEDELGTARSLRSRANVDFDKRVRKTEIVPWRGAKNENEAVRGIVHDENAFVLTGDGGSGHAGMFGTVHAVLRFGCAALDAIARGEGPLRTEEPPSWLVRVRPGGSLRAGFDGKSETGSSAGSRCGPHTFGHLGFTGTSLWIDPDANAVVVVLTNRVHPTRDNVLIREARPKLHDALFDLALR